MKNYFIIHGSFGNSKENWFPWLENELKIADLLQFSMYIPSKNAESQDKNKSE